MTDWPDDVRSVRVIEVIEVVVYRGAGVMGNPGRLVTQHWSKEGVRLAEDDPDTRKQ